MNEYWIGLRANFDKFGGQLDKFVCGLMGAGVWVDV